LAFANINTPRYHLNRTSGSFLTRTQFPRVRRLLAARLTSVASGFFSPIASGFNSPAQHPLKSSSTTRHRRRPHTKMVQLLMVATIAFACTGRPKPGPPTSDTCSPGTPEASLPFCDRSLGFAVRLKIQNNHGTSTSRFACDDRL
jgi:hypothetical protein